MFIYRLRLCRRAPVENHWKDTTNLDCGVQEGSNSVNVAVRTEMSFRGHQVGRRRVLDRNLFFGNAGYPRSMAIQKSIYILESWRLAGWLGVFRSAPPLFVPLRPSAAAKSPSASP